mgnify:CR=1 FL=1
MSPNGDSIVQAGAHGDGAQTVAQYLHRHGMAVVGDQQHGGGKGGGVGDLPHDAVCVHHRLAVVDAGRVALVDDDLLLVGVEVHRGKFGDQHPVVAAPGIDLPQFQRLLERDLTCASSFKSRDLVV